MIDGDSRADFAAPLEVGDERLENLSELRINVALDSDC
jgi:hypothetical protein